MKTKDDTPSFGKDDYEIVKREAVYSGIFTLARFQVRHRLFNGGWSETFVREVLERYSAAAVLPYDPVLDRVILIEQFRIGSKQWLLEVPAGILVGDDTYENVAYHEAEEEAGCTLTELLPISEYFVSPGGATEYLHLYCGKVDATNIGGVHGLKHEHEDIRVLNISYDDAIKKLNAGEIKTSPAIISLLWLQINRTQLRKQWRRD